MVPSQSCKLEAEAIALLRKVIDASGALKVRKVSLELVPTAAVVLCTSAAVAAKAVIIAAVVVVV